METETKFRLPLMALVLLTLLAALWAGLYRIGWAIPALRPGLPMSHGPSMVAGFLGTVISIERAVALRERWTYLAPLLSVVGAVFLIVDGSNQIGPTLIGLGSLVFMVISIVILRRQLALYTGTMALGAAAWLIGNGLWLAGRALPEVVFWWAGFLVLTIVGERLELSRVTRLGALGYSTFALSAGMVVAGLMLSSVEYAAGVRLASVGFVALTLWLLTFDVARRNVNRPGLSRFIALNLLLGYVWLGAGGVLGIRYVGVMAGPNYDAILHTLFLGFTLSMIFAHALIILPAITGMTIPFHRALYGPVAILHISLLMRVTGDLALRMPLRRWGGLLNVVALLMFLLMLVGLAIRERRRI
jgi:hypothetical protein